MFPFSNTLFNETARLDYISLYLVFALTALLNETAHLDYISS